MFYRLNFPGTRYDACLRSNLERIRKEPERLAGAPRKGWSSGSSCNGRPGELQYELAADGFDVYQYRPHQMTLRRTDEFESGRRISPVFVVCIREALLR